MVILFPLGSIIFDPCCGVPNILISETLFREFNELPCPTYFKYEYSEFEFKAGISKIFLSPENLENIPGSTIGLVSGGLIKKIFIGKSENMFRKLMGSILQ